MTAELSSSDGYVIAILSRPAEPEQLNRIFEEILGEHPADARIWTRHLPGILKEVFSKDDADSLVAAIGAAGLPVVSFPRDAIPHLHRALAAHHARCESDGLLLVDFHGTPSVLIPWGEIRMICVGEVPLEQARHYPPGTWAGISAGHHYQRPMMVTPLTPGLQVWITCNAPYPHLRIDHDHLNYEYLGDRRVESATTNFRNFIEDLTKFATAACLPESTKAWLGHIQPEHYRFATPEALLDYATLQGALASKKS